MLAVNQKVLVIPDKGAAFDATIIATAKGDGGPPAYKVTANNLDAEQPGQWHKACDIFVPDQTWQEKKDSWDQFLKE